MNTIEKIKIGSNVILQVEESISGKLSWTAEMPKGELDKLKKVCKPVSTDRELTIWVLDENKVNFIS